MNNDPAPAPRAAEETNGTGTGWQDQHESAEAIAALAERIGEQQRRVAASRNAGLDGRIARGQHQKQHLGARGTLRIFDDIPPVLRSGPFVTPGTRPVACRFSSGQPCPLSDNDADVRGVALKFFTPLDVETDLLMTNEGGRSHARTASQFMDFADILVARIEGGASAALQVLISELHAGKMAPDDLPRIVAILTRETILHSVDSLATERYWGSVVALGDLAMKYSLLPHPATAPGSDGAGRGDDYLRQDLLHRLQEGPLKWQLCVQLFVDEKRTPVNDASIAWAGTPIAVAELEIAAPASDADEQLINQMAFNPCNGFAPLGITHARKEVYAASARNRASRGLLSSEQARRFLG
ncbi:catalase [Accumulibacter sp.]|uniref:catalase n=1 Tax=Accumulibacter sp. TaxID=2053492 RepID=UPI0026158FF4|nr:catalase [Accumulibacter sp.]